MKYYTQAYSRRTVDDGDIRVNLLMPLMMLHTLWMREHNRIAEELHSFNPDWNDETLFQESRRLLIAELQHITYREFLPVMFDFRKRKQFGLLIDDTEDYDSYDETMNPGIHHGFSTAAFRFGHTLVQDNVELRDENYELREELQLRDTYMNPSLLYNGGFDGVIRGMLRQKAQDVHRYTTEEIRGRLMQRYFQNHGFDLTAMSIERGRDHGIPPYLQWRKFCNLPIPNSWEDLYQFMKKDYVDSLRNVYLSIEDIDLLPGGLGEYHEEGSLVGPTYTCLINKQFLALRRGDRFWFENPNQPGSFTKDQLKEIYKSSFARILCDNSDDLYMIQKYPFFIPSKENPIIPCEEIAKVDLSQWTEYSS
ncbi:peroxidasin [Trichonephila clavata]|uniref:Peroxidasin n=1 Tax=Trichonephila clavata TaxID=2740835 RepID=A0A8X6HI73_TRICU|nr:peroxidasin [Trichonephila clavata]